MNATRQLWLATALVMGLLFLCATALNLYWARANLLDDLATQASADAAIIAANDSATALPPAITLSRYARIQVTEFDGTIAAAAGPDVSPSAPGWLAAVFNIQAPAASADIVRGGKTVGTVTTETNVTPLLNALWQLVWQSAALFGAGAVIMALLSGAVLQRILRSVGRVVHQAEALAGGDYATSPDPVCRELEPATAALAILGKRVDDTLTRKQASARPAPVTEDALTGLPNRATFLATLKAELRREDAGSLACVCLIHLNALADLNRQYGRAATDIALQQIAAGLKTLCRQHNHWQVARPRGAEFALFAGGSDDPTTVAEQARGVVEGILRERGMADAVHLPIAAARVVRGHSAGQTLARLDGVLAAGIAAQTSDTHVAGDSDFNIRPVEAQLAHWRTVFEASFADLGFSLATFPVAGLEGELLHLESPIRLAHEGSTLSAGEFLPWIHSLALAPALDRHVVELALAHIAGQGQPLCIHLTASALAEPAFLGWLGEQLSANAQVTQLLSLEFAEDVALLHIDALRRFSSRVRTLGARVGIEHAGHQLGELNRLAGVELDYLKIDGLFTRAIDASRGHQALVRALCELARGQDMLPIAEGVRTESERQALAKLGVGGVTGPAVKVPVTPA